MKLAVGGGASIRQSTYWRTWWQGACVPHTEPLPRFSQELLGIWVPAFQTPDCSYLRKDVGRSREL